MKRKDKTLDMIARRRIVNWRRNAGMSQAQLGKKIGRQPTWVSRYENQQFDADLGTIARMAEAFGQTLYAALDIPSQDPYEQELIECYRAINRDARGLALQVMCVFAGKHKRRSRQGGVGRVRQQLIDLTPNALKGQ